MNTNKTRITFYVSDSVRDRIDRAANEIGISVSSFVSVAVFEKLKQDSVIDMAEMFISLEERLKNLGIDVKDDVDQFEEENNKN